MEENSYIHVTNVKRYSVRQFYNIRRKGKIIFRVNVPFVQWFQSCMHATCRHWLVKRFVKQSSLVIINLILVQSVN